jgi:ADP-L-glycero-D-manno-heptose 6-epimerase
MFDRNAVIMVTGAAGFIGSYLTGFLNRKSYSNIIIVDDFARLDKHADYESKKIIAKVERDELFDWLNATGQAIDFVFHLGARTDTTEFDYSIHEKLNVEYSKRIWEWCTKKSIPLVYASSAATYGNGDFGYKDDHAIVSKLQPLNAYGISKNEFDKWVLERENDKKSCPPFWAGLKFFNVYGPNEYHKGRMASVILHAFNQIQATGGVKLFRSHHPDFKDGEQLRDFVYVEDVALVCFWLMEKSNEINVPVSALYNLGTGQARTFKDLVNAIFTSMKLPSNITYIDTPEDIRDKYQYFTQADMHKLRNAGYHFPFHSLEEGVHDYVQGYLVGNTYY